jgi:cephalosporin-C deacetylase
METDLALSALETYRSDQTAPADFDDLWRQTLNEARALASEPRIVSIHVGLATLDVFGVTFSGFGGRSVRAWFRRPHGIEESLPIIVRFVGYGGGRGLPTEDLLWASSGFAHLYVDTRGQGSAWSTGDTPDPEGSGPQAPGLLTRGILSPDTFYYRCVFTDAVRAVETARQLPGAGPRRTFAVGATRGGGIALVVAGLASDLAGVVPQVPFLCDIPRAVRINDTEPYMEIVGYLAVHRDQTNLVLNTLSYVDGVNHASRASAAARFSVALTDATCKPSTVYGAFHAYRGPKTTDVFGYNWHEGGGSAGDAAAVHWTHELDGVA